MPSATLLLPAAARFADEALPADLARALGRGDAVDTPRGIEGVFDVLPRGWPVAAVTRQADAGDAAGAQWLRVDPAFVRPDINGARLLAIGESLALDALSADVLLKALRPLFGDAGMPIDAPTPSRWYLCLAPQAPLPRFAPPDDALGADLFEQLPDGPEGRRWRALLSEAQVVLHNHPLNAQRAAQGLPPVNSVWFWGAGRLPDRVQAAFDLLLTDDPVAHAFARLTPARAAPRGDAWSTPDAGTVVDLRALRRLDQLVSKWIEPARVDLAARRIQTLRLAWPDRQGIALRRSQALRFWRRPLRSLLPRTPE
ncbi:phosphoglycerate mutase [Lysobacter humi (ex Lee et al. 2017)]